MTRRRVRPTAVACNRMKAALPHHGIPVAVTTRMSKSGLSVLLASIAFLPLVTPHVVHADPVQAAPAEDKTLSPFFVVDGAKPGVEALPLESTRADVHIAGVISDVTVTQTYRNDGDRTISAKYVFPASTRAAVYAMKMTIGDRVIVAKIKEREEAKHEFDAAKAAGKTATLLEEERPNVFTMSVANVLPKDRDPGRAEIHRAARAHRRHLRVGLSDRGRTALRVRDHHRRQRTARTSSSRRLISTPAATPVYRLRHPCRSPRRHADPADRIAVAHDRDRRSRRTTITRRSTSIRAR